jgi:chemotaxis protein CheX
MNTITPQGIDETCDLLKTCFCEVFSTVFEISAQPSQVSDLRRQNKMLVAGSVGFIGDVNGVVYIYVEETFARTLTSKMLMLSEAEIDGVELVNDVIAEISNMVVGSTKSRLCDSGAVCQLTIPSILRGTNVSAEPSGSSECRLISMDCNGHCILLELLMKPQS